MAKNSQPTFLALLISFLKRLSTVFKILGIVVLALLLLIPLSFVEGLLGDRLQRSTDATNEITSTWGQSQQVAGAVLIVPYRYYYTEKKEVVVNGQPVQQEVETSALDQAYFLPHTFKVEGTVTPRIRYKGIYQAVVYDADLQLSGEFTQPDFTAFKNLGKYEVLWDQATLAFPIHDLRGVQETLSVAWAGKDLVLLPQSTLKFYPQGVHGVVPNLSAKGTSLLPFNLSLTLRGSGDINFAPVGMDNVVHLASGWPSPGFKGAFLPTERKITPQGFDAIWKVSYYGRNFPQQWRDADSPLNPDDFNTSYFGVNFIATIDSYRNVERSINYGILFITLIFVTFFLFETLTRWRVHIIQYALVGAALVLFYLALLSLSEFLNFGLSYLIAAGASILLITAYTAKILGNLRFALYLTVGLALVYGVLYVILQLEDYSLLVGTAGLFVGLGAVMYVTRNIDWYAQSEK